MGRFGNLSQKNWRFGWLSNWRNEHQGCGKMKGHTSVLTIRTISDKCLWYFCSLDMPLYLVHFGLWGSTIVWSVQALLIERKQLSTKYDTKSTQSYFSIFYRTGSHAMFQFTQFYIRSLNFCRLCTSQGLPFFFDRMNNELNLNRSDYMWVRIFHLSVHNVIQATYKFFLLVVFFLTRFT